jgi:hypothetical protein
VTVGRRRTTRPASLCAVLTLAGALLAVLIIAVATAKAGARERKVTVMSELVMQWPRRFRAEALQVIDCETGGTFTPFAVGAGGLYYGLFQMGSWARHTFGFDWTIRGQIKSGWRAFRANGYCWTCSSQWPVCGRGLDG